MNLLKRSTKYVALGVDQATTVTSVREEWTELERRVFYTSLSRATGKDFGQDSAAWMKWCSNANEEQTE